MGLQSALGEARDAGEDLVGGLDPDVRLAGFVVDVDELLDGGNQCAHAAMRTASQLLVVSAANQRSTRFIQEA